MTVGWLTLIPLFPFPCCVCFFAPFIVRVLDKDLTIVNRVVLVPRSEDRRQEALFWPAHGHQLDLFETGVVKVAYSLTTCTRHKSSRCFS